MDQREIAQVSQALDNWLTSQELPANIKAPTLLRWVACEIVAQGDTPERLNDGLQILTDMLKAFTLEALMIAKKHGAR